MPTQPDQSDVLRAHGVLDRAGIPRCDDDGLPISLALRIAVLVSERDDARQQSVPEGGS